MLLQSTAFSDNHEIPKQFTCLGENVNPPLEITEMPQETKSWVLIVEDRDATPIPWIHWLIFNIPPKITAIAAHSLPVGSTEGLANGNTFGYEGPCPKYFTGTHHYTFTAYALDTVLQLERDVTAHDVRSAMNGHILAQTALSGICTA